jgi:Transglycosylase SLT domain
MAWRLARYAATALCGSALLLIALPACADVWGYVDAKGVARFSAEKMDERYELFFKGETSFDTRDGLSSLGKSDSLARPDADMQTPRPVDLTTRQSKLLVFFEISPHFKAVKHHMREASTAHNMDFELLQALIATESSFDSAVVSPKGAVGLMQLMPSTAQRYGVSGDTKCPSKKSSQILK